MKNKKTTFEKGDQIRLKISRLCYLMNDTKTVLIKPSYLLTYEKGNINQCYFKVSFNKEVGEPTTANNGDFVRISRPSFENLGFEIIETI